MLAGIVAFLFTCGCVMLADITPSGRRITGALRTGAIKEVWKYEIMVSK
jgi:hypothetical protein